MITPDANLPLSQVRPVEATDADFLDEFIAERTEGYPAFPSLVEEMLEQRRRERKGAGS